MSKIYVASSWRNAWQPEVVDALRKAGHDVFDFRHPWKGYEAFQWSDISPNWQDWTVEEYRQGLVHPVAEEKFGLTCKVPWQVIQRFDIICT